MSDENNGNAPDSGDQTNDKAPATPEKPTGTGEKMVPKSRLDQVIAQRKRADDAIKFVVTELREDIPEEFRDLVPDIEPAEQVKWIRNAVSKGLFEKAPASGPDSKRPGGKPPIDYENMTPQQMMEAGYKS